MLSYKITQAYSSYTHNWTKHAEIVYYHMSYTCDHILVKAWVHPHYRSCAPCSYKCNFITHGMHAIVCLDAYPVTNTVDIAIFKACLDVLNRCFSDIDIYHIYMCMVCQDIRTETAIHKILYSETYLEDTAMRDHLLNTSM